MTTLVNWFKKYFLLAILLIVSFIFFYFHLFDYLTLTTFKKYQHLAQSWTLDHYLTSIFAYTSFLAILIACAIPCATFFALLGGFLFGPIAIIYAEIGTTLGGFLLYTAVRTAVGPGFVNRSKGLIKAMEQGFQENAFYYLLFLRLMPIFPCWISNISAGVLNIPVKTFVSATVLGLLPSTIIYVLAGQSLDTLLNDDKTPLINIILQPPVFISLLGLIFLSLLPIIYKKFKKYNKTR